MTTLTVREAELLRRSAALILAGEWPWEPEKVGERDALMNAAEKLETGPLAIVFRPLLVSGMLGEAKGRTVMLIDNEQPKPEQARAVWHETVHLLLLSAGHKQQDEGAVEAIALRLAEACPEIVTLLGPA